MINKSSSSFNEVIHNNEKDDNWIYVISTRPALMKLVMVLQIP